MLRREILFSHLDQLTSSQGYISVLAAHEAHPDGGYILLMHLEAVPSCQGDRPAACSCPSCFKLSPAEADVER